MELRQKTLDSLRMDDKVVVITGAAGGIGLGTAQLFAAMGGKVAIFDIQDELGEKEALAIRDAGGDAIYVNCDVTSPESCETAINKVVDKFGKINVLFNNAGVAVRKNAVDLSIKEWDLAMNVTLRGIYLVSHYAIPHMVDAGGGSIINSGSGWSLKGGGDAISYCAAKGGAWNMTRAMAIDHGKDNIRVNCVAPGDVDTAMLRSECAQLGEDEDEFMKDAAARPLNRVGEVNDVANAVLFLASDLSSWVTGTHIVVDGGGIA